MHCFCYQQQPQLLSNAYCLRLQARFFFQQLISGVSYCHAMVCESLLQFSFFFFRNLCSSYRYTKKLTFLVLLFPIKQVCHRDLKLENTLLDGSPAPRLKICDFGYSKVIMQELNKHMHVERHFSKLEHCKIIM